MLESNNTSAKLFTNRSRKESRIGSANFVKELNSQWTTTINQGGLQINPGDQITISSTQVNLRGEPDQCLEFSGSTNSTFKEAILDNKTTAEFGFYITNRQQYNMNLPLATHRNIENVCWMDRTYTMPKVLMAMENEWPAFFTSYPCCAIEGYAKRHSSTAFGAVKTETTAGPEEGIIMEYWDPIKSDAITPTQQTDQGQQGFYHCGHDDSISTPVANGNFEIASPNETRMYVCRGTYQGTYGDTDGRSASTYNYDAGPTIYSDTLITKDIEFEVEEGFITPGSLGSDLTTIFHERTGSANNWASEEIKAHVYVHNALWANNSLIKTDAPVADRNPAPPAKLNGGGNLGYWASLTESRQLVGDQRPISLQKIPVSDITDKSYITILTSTGALLDKIWEDPNQEKDSEARKSKWGMGANIPNNIDFYWNGQPAVTPNPTAEADGTWGRRYKGSDGRDLYYNNLLTGDINRTQSIEVWNGLSGNTVSQHALFDPASVMNYKNFIQDLEENREEHYGLYRGQDINWPAGPNYSNPAAGPPSFAKQGIFGKMICLMDNYVDVSQGSGYQDPAYLEGSQGIASVSSFQGDGTGGVDRYTMFTVDNACSAMFPGEDFDVIPLNILASPINIALVKKALYRSREILPGAVPINFDSPNWQDGYATRLDVGVKDDAMCINANIPNGYANPNLTTPMVSVPPPYIIAQGYYNGYNASTLTPPTLYPVGLNSYKGIDIAAPSANVLNNAMPRLFKDGKQNIQQKSSIYCKTFWNDDCDPANGKLTLPTTSQFSFTNGDGVIPDYTQHFKPGGVPGKSGLRYDWLDGNENGLDEGVGLCVVYYNETLLLQSDVGLEAHPDNTNRNAYYTNLNFPTGATDIFPGIDKSFPERNMVPFLAVISPKLNAANKYQGLQFNQRCVPTPYIGEMCGFSSAFSDGKYAKVVTTQRVNPKSYETINDKIQEANTRFNPQAWVFDSQMYNIYDYYPYIHVGAIDPQIQFSETSGRFELSKFHTPATSSNGAWQDPQGNGAGQQASDEIVIMNGRRSFLSHATATMNIKGFYQGRLRSVLQIGVQSVTDLAESARGAGNSLLETMSDNLCVLPWGEIHQDTIRSQTISSQSGIGLLNYSFLSVGNNAQRINAFTPQLFEETMFYKMGFSIEQLLPFAGNQNNNFNRSNYNKFLGTDQELVDKTNNMVYPFTTNGYSTSEQSFNTVTNSWKGYDTCYAVNSVVGGASGTTGETGLTDGVPATTRSYSFYNGESVVPSKTKPLKGRPELTFQIDSGDNSTANLKELPPNEVLTMFSLGGNSFGNESVATVDSDSLIATALPSKFNYSYLVIYSDIVGQSSNFITGSNLMIPTPAIGYMTRNYSSADFMYSFDSDFNYVADRSFLLNNFNVEIRQPNGRLANIENNSTIIFKIVKNIRPVLPVAPPVLKTITAEDKQDEKEMDETIKEFV
tara:strand:+ start:1766 stop:6103 length:4338 start_codon:yes stop_codon:yes gene_type:complete